MAIVHSSADAPSLVPAAACDYTTGHLTAWGVAEALRRQQTEGGSWHVDTSLCQTAMWFLRLGADLDPAAALGVHAAETTMVDTPSPWGHLRHLGPVAEVAGSPPRWDRPSVPPGTDPPTWVRE